MANNGFNVKDLYPADYSFNWEAFNADPENYEFTAADIAYSNAMELEKYESETNMTPYEKRALRRWVASGHSVMEPPPSKYLCIYPFHPFLTFLDVYRTDRELDAATKGMSQEEKTAYLKNYFGHVDETDEERAAKEENERLYKETPEKVKEKIRMLQRELQYTWQFIMEKGYMEEADEYIAEHMDDPTPFEDEW